MKNEEEINATVEELPGTVDSLPDKLKAIGAFKEELLIYRDTYYKDPLTGEKHNAVSVVCTACHESFVADKFRCETCHAGYATAPFGFWDPEYKQTVISEQSCTCPICGAQAKAKHIGSFRSTVQISCNYCLTIHNIRNHLVILEWNVSRYADKEGNTSFVINGFEGMMVIGNKPIRVVKYFNNCGQICYLGEWQYRVKYYEELQECAIERIFYDEEDILTSECGNSALDVYIKSSKANCYPGAYLATWCKYPNIENLIRQDLTKFTNRCLDRAYTSYGSGYTVYHHFVIKNLLHYLNLKKAKPHEILGCDKQELPAFRIFKTDTIDTWKQLHNNGTKLPITELVNLERAGTNFIHWQELTKEPYHGVIIPVLRTIHYICKQQDKQERAVNKYAIDIGYIKDYWNMLFRLDGHLDKSVMFPKDIIHEHNRVNEEIIAKENAERKARLSKELAELDVKIEKIVDKLSNHCFTDEELGLCIRPCHSATELVNEGKILQHCVGTYREKVAKGETMIYFVRRIDEPDAPFYTLEYRDKKIIQDHGKNNKLQTEEILKFEEKWLMHLESIREKKHGKRNATGEHKSAHTA